MQKTLILILLSAVAASAEPIVPGKSPTPPRKKPPLLSSDLNGRDMLFIAQAVEHGKTVNFLAAQAEKTSNPGLSDFGKSITKSGAVQSAVIQSLAEMRKVRVPSAESAEQKKYTLQFSKLQGAELDKAILNALIETSGTAVVFYELSEDSGDSAIRGCVGQILPQLREHLLVARTLAGSTFKEDPARKLQK